MFSYVFIVFFYTVPIYAVYISYKSKDVYITTKFLPNKKQNLDISSYTIYKKIPIPLDSRTSKI